MQVISPEQIGSAPPGLAEAVLQQSTSGVAVFSADERLGLVWANPAFASLLNLPGPQGRAPSTLREVFPSEARTPAGKTPLDLAEHVRDTGEPVVREQLRLCRPSQATAYWLFGVSPLLRAATPEDGQRHLLVTCTDVTEQSLEHEQVEAERKRLEALHVLSGALMAAHTPEEVVAAAKRSMTQVLPAEHFAVFTYNEGFQALVLLSGGEALPPGVTAASLRLPLDWPGVPLIETYRDGRLRSFLLPADEPPSSPPEAIARMTGIRAVACAPLQTGGERFGIVVAGRTEPEPFGGDSLALLEAAAARISAALARAEAERLSAIMEHTRAHLAYLDRDFRFVRVNSAYARGSGYDEADLIGRNHFDLFPSDENRAIFERVRDTGQPFQVQARPFVYEGQPERGVTYWDWTLTPIKDRSGCVQGLVFSLVDVTEPVRLRQEAQRRAAELETILGSVADGVLLFGPSGELVGMNPSAESILGQTLVELRRRAGSGEGGRLLGLPTAGGGASPLDRLPTRRALGGEVIGAIEVALARPDGSALDLVCSGAPLRGHEGDVIGAVVTIQDITAIRELDRHKDEFISVASHELKSPLTSTKGFCQVLMRRAERRPGCEQCVANLRSIDSQVNRVVKLVDQLLDVSRMEVGRLALNREPTDLIEVVVQAAANAQVSTPRHQIRVRAEVDDVLGKWDRARLEQVIDNLLSNAVKYSPQGGAIDVVVAAAAGEAKVTVTDQGVGIAPEDQVGLFTRYYRTGGTRTAAIEGLGLGLYISAGIVEQHGGRMLIQSEPGRGSTFGFALPLAAG